VAINLGRSLAGTRFKELLVFAFVMTVLCAGLFRFVCTCPSPSSSSPAWWCSDDVELLGNLSLGFATALSLQNLGLCLVGCLVGTLVGVLPGIGPIATITMLLPITFGVDPVGALSCWRASTTARSTAARPRPSSSTFRAR